MGNLYTIGHSNVEMDFFLSLLKRYNVDCLLDVRSVPYSKFANQFNRYSLQRNVTNNNIRYIYMGNYLGARQDNRNFYDNDGILDFEKVRAGENFNIMLKNIEKRLNENHNIALMCAEKDPFNCHRAIMVARGFELDNVDVKHILHTEEILTQEELNHRLLNHFFPHRDQLTLNFDGVDEKTDKEYLLDAYRKRNKEIGYNLHSKYEEMLDE